eukprot:TRINITY_DN2762_c0_g1_i4.p1 TRINITY_DN2762_c0_g1~~TRINITY_DN2762_c0_g1_i4.p1  ORF type:complete len:652 (+),score=98.58 TRINITY_DN2762_c0_g1_i4:61-2016(+)
MAANDLLSLPNVSLHPAHMGSRQQSASALEPLRESVRQGYSSSCRKTALQDLLNKLVPEEVLASRKQETCRYKVCLIHMTLHIESDAGELLDIPLLFSDIIEAEARGDGAGYLVAVAPRPAPTVRKGSTLSFEDASKAWSPPLDDVWVFFVDGSYLDLQQLFFEMGSRGALRWDLLECYSARPNPLGEGGEGTVFLGQSTISDKSNQVAIKTLKPRKTQEAEVRVRTEIGFLARVRGHPNVTTLYGVFCDLVQKEEQVTDVQQAADGERRDKVATVTWSIVMELCKSGDLFEHLLEHGPLDTNGCALLMEGLFSALEHLHGLGIVHRDVKPENILMDSCSKPILADMGIAANLDDNRKVTGVIGSPGYAAPEVLLQQPYNQLVDIFSAGCTYYFAAACKQPFVADTINGTLSLTMRCQPPFPKKHFSHVSIGLVALIKSCMSKDSSRRPDASQALECLSELQATQASRHNMPNLSQPAEEVAGRPAAPARAEPSTPSAGALEQSTSAISAVPAGPSERQRLLEQPAAAIGDQEKQEMLKKSAGMAPEGAQELALMPAAGQEGKLHGGRGRVSLSTPAKAFRRMAGGFSNKFFPSFAQHSGNSASAGPAEEFFPVSSSHVSCVRPASQGPLECNPVAPQSAPSRRSFSRRRR